jgi:hypothetical protein
MSDPEEAATRPARIARWLGLDHNPLRRRSDRMQTFVMAVLLAAFAVGSPISVIAVSHIARTATVRAEQTQQGWRRVPAVLLQASPKSAGMYQSATFAWVQAKWKAPNGTVHVGDVLAASGTKAGAAVRIWIDSAGNLTTTPLNSTQMVDRVIAAVVFAPIVLGIVLLSVAAIVRRAFERRRIIRWEIAWEAIEPQWTHRA